MDIPKQIVAPSFDGSVCMVKDVIGHRRSVKCPNCGKSDESVIALVLSPITRWPNHVIVHRACQSAHWSLREIGNDFVQNH